MIDSRAFPIVLADFTQSPTKHDIDVWGSKLALLLTRACAENTFLVYLSARPLELTPELRKYAAKRLQELTPAQNERWLGYIAVGSTPAVRGNVTALKWQLPESFPLSLVQTSEHAIAMARELLRPRGIGLPLVAEERFRSLCNAA